MRRCGAFSPYGLSKGLTWQYYRFLSQTMGFPLGKFVIPNPFGPFEEPRFCNYLVQTWFKGEVPAIRTPLYVRDNIHVDLLATFVCSLCQLPFATRRRIIKLNPSFYVESQGAFANRFATEMAPRLGIACPITLLQQSEFGEPMVRINTDRVDGNAFGWKRSRSLGCRSRILQSPAAGPPSGPCLTEVSRSGFHLVGAREKCCACAPGFPSRSHDQIAIGLKRSPKTVTPRRSTFGEQTLCF